MTEETSVEQATTEKEYKHDYDVDVLTYSKGQAASGGVRVVVDAINPENWFGGIPGGEETPEKLWNATGGLDGPFGMPFVRQGTKDADKYQTLNIKLPAAIREKHYDFANLIPWPEAHEMQILLEDDITLEDINELYDDYYVRFNEIVSVNYDKHAKQENYTGAKNILHSHDYQMMTGGIYSNHIPVPTLKYLEDTKIPNRDGDMVALVDAPFFRDRIAKYAMNPLNTFQRETDQINMITILNYFDQRDHAMIDSVTKYYEKKITKTEDQKEIKRLGKERDIELKQFAGFVENNPQLFGEGKPLHGLDVHDEEQRQKMVEKLRDIVSEGELTQLNYMGKNISLLSVPVGLNVKEAFAMAQTVHSEDRTFSTVYKDEKKDFLFRGITGKNPETKEYTYAEYNPTNLDSSFFPNKGPNKKDPTLDDVFTQVEDREIMLALHRNDYTKGTLEILDGVEEFFDKKIEDSEAINQTLFLTLPPTRFGVKGYEDTAKAVLEKVKRMKNKYGEESVVLVPGVDPADALRLMRKEQVKAFLAPSFRDGYCLTPEEFVVANSDRTGEDLFVISSSGSGNSDFLSDGKKGAYIVQMPKTFEEFQSVKGRKNVSSQIAEALISGFNPENAEQNKENWKYMVSQAKAYDANHFNKAIFSNYEKAMEWAFSKDTRFPELANDNQEIDWKKIPYEFLIHRDWTPAERTRGDSDFPEHTTQNFDRRSFVDRVGQKAAADTSKSIIYTILDAEKGAEEDVSMKR
jgi:hypothetical protein